MLHLIGPQRRLVLSTVTILGCLISAAASSTADWMQIKNRSCGEDNRLCAVGSGMALIEQQQAFTKFLVVHDQNSGSNKLGVVTIDARGSLVYTPVYCEGLDGKDLEAVSAIPNHKFEFLVASSQGEFYLIKINGTKAVITTFPHPALDQPRATKQELEGLSVEAVGEGLVVAWGYRGAGATETGLFCYGTLDLANRKITPIGQRDVLVDFPEPNDNKKRHIADLRIDRSGVVWAAATYDPRNAGPFSSVVYILGVLQVSGTNVGFHLTKNPIPLWRFSRKVEAIEFVPGPNGGVAFGADDEDFGGWIYFE